MLTTAPQAGFGNLILPAQIGARRMAFPMANALSFWTTAAALITLLSSTFVPGGQRDLWLDGVSTAFSGSGGGPGPGARHGPLAGEHCSVAIASTMRLDQHAGDDRASALPGGHDLAATAADGMGVADGGDACRFFAFSVLLAALLLLFCDRHMGTGFYLPAGDLVNGTLRSVRARNGSPLLWLHLFWFFGHPEVYIAILPGMGADVDAAGELCAAARVCVRHR